MLEVLARVRAGRLNRLALTSLAAGENDKATDLALGARAMLPGRGRGLAGAAARAGVLLTLSAVAEEKRDHGKSAAWLEEAVRILQDASVSGKRAIWLAEIFARLGDTLRLIRK